MTYFYIGEIYSTIPQFPHVYSMQFLYKSTHYSVRYKRKFR